MEDGNQRPKLGVYWWEGRKGLQSNEETLLEYGAGHIWGNRGTEGMWYPGFWQS